MVIVQNFSICIPTYKRPEFLRDLLVEIFEQCELSDNIAIEILVADNDVARSAESVVNSFVNKNPKCKFSYILVEQRGLSAIRNVLVYNASFPYIVLVDDDQAIAKDFLQSLLTVFPTIPEDMIAGQFSISCRFEPGFPEEMQNVANKMFANNQLLPFEVIRYMGTNGVLLHAEKVKAFNIVFRNEFSLTSGEDNQFFFDLSPHGKLMALPQVKVFERLPAHRGTKNYLFLRSMHRGALYSKLAVLNRFVPSILNCILSALLSVVTIPLLVILIVLPKSTRIEVLVFYFRQWGKLLGLVQIVPKFYANLGLVRE